MGGKVLPVDFLGRVAKHITRKLTITCSRRLATFGSILRLD